MPITFCHSLTLLSYVMIVATKHSQIFYMSVSIFIIDQRGQMNFILNSTDLNVKVRKVIIEKVHCLVLT